MSKTRIFCYTRDLLDARLWVTSDEGAPESRCALYYFDVPRSARRFWLHVEPVTTTTRWSPRLENAIDLHVCGLGGRVRGGNECYVTPTLADGGWWVTREFWDGVPPGRYAAWCEHEVQR